MIRVGRTTRDRADRLAFSARLSALRYSLKGMATKKRDEEGRLFGAFRSPTKDCPSRARTTLLKEIVPRTPEIRTHCADSGSASVVRVRRRGVLLGRGMVGGAFPANGANANCKMINANCRMGSSGRWSNRWHRAMGCNRVAVRNSSPRRGESGATCPLPPRRICDPIGEEESSVYGRGSAKETRIRLPTATA
jgi:hypothetical protein